MKGDDTEVAESVKDLLVDIRWMFKEIVTELRLLRRRKKK
jgi:hypothetical protein